MKVRMVPIESVTQKYPRMIRDLSRTLNKKMNLVITGEDVYKRQDTYRIAATDQLRTFANILDTPLSVIYTATELNSAVAEYAQADVIFVDKMCIRDRERA